MDGLEAHYALLREAAARRQALQRKLRAQLPMVWADGALVMSRAARRRAESVEVARDEGDEISELLDEWRDAGRRRKLEWEVTRRIARVDRELQTKPRTKRFWHEKHASVVAKGQEAPKAERRGKKVSSGVQTDESVVRLLKAREEKVGMRGGKDANVKPGRYMQPTASWKAATRQGIGDTTAVEVASSKQRHVVVEDRGKLEAINTPRRTGHTDDLTALSHSPKDQKTNDEVSATVNNSQAPSSPSLRLENEPKNTSLEQSETLMNTLDAISSPKPHSSQNDQLDVDEASEEKEFSGSHTSSPVKPDSVRNHGVKSERPSSIGRQVLSDYRTMPSVASFGPGPAVSGRVAQTKQAGHAASNGLSPDVLRRLFSDLDSNRDGHINRIETCLALHRLQVSVSAPKIATFFRNVNEASGSLKSQYRPMHEVINFKQFAAFVTAAFDQQRQAARAEISARREESSRVWHNRKRTKEPDALYPSLAVPMMNKGEFKTERKATTVESNNTYRIQSDTLRYQVDEPVMAVSRSVELTDEIVRDMPDMLVASVLASKSSLNKSAEVSDKLDAKALVRKSLDRIPQDLLRSDEKMTMQIVQELIKEQLRVNLDTKVCENEDEDLTGLRRAAAYFEKQVSLEATPTGDCMSEEPKAANEWLEFVTEEQVATIVHEIWRENGNPDRIAKLPMPDVADNVILDNDLDMLTEVQPQERVTAEQNIQAELDTTNQQPNSTAGGQQEIAAELAAEVATEALVTQRIARTHLGQLLMSLIPEHQGRATDQLFDSLRKLRRQRNEQQNYWRMNAGSEISSSEGIAQDDDDHQSSLSSSVDADDNILAELSLPQTNKENVEPITSTEIDRSDPCLHSNIEEQGIPLHEKHLRMPDLRDFSYNSSINSSSIRSALSSVKPQSSCALSSRSCNTSSSIENRPILNVVNRRIRTNTLRRRRCRYPQYSRNRANLSEGEVDPGDASEGEIVGQRRDKYAQATLLSGARSSVQSKRDSDSEGLYSSVESGELDSHGLQSSYSSRESGELAVVRPLLIHPPVK